MLLVLTAPYVLGESCAFSEAFARAPQATQSPASPGVLLPPAGALAQVEHEEERTSLPVTVEPTAEDLGWHLTELRRWEERIRPGSFVVSPPDVLAGLLTGLADQAAGLPDFARPQEQSLVVDAQLEALFFLADWSRAAPRSAGALFEAAQDTIVAGLPGGPLARALSMPTLAQLAEVERGPADTLILALARRDIPVNRWLAAVDRALPAAEATVIRGVQPSIARIVGDGAGTGVNLRADGLVLTNAHVAGNLGARVRIELPDGYPFHGTCIAIDPVFDLALIDFDGANLPTAMLAPEAPTVGQRVITVGNPGVNGRTPFQVDTGTILGFAPDRSGPQEMGATAHDVQTDWGHSGSPLFDTHGAIVAMHNSYEPANAMRHAVSWEAMRMFLRRYGVN